MYTSPLLQLFLGKKNFPSLFLLFPRKGKSVEKSVSKLHPGRPRPERVEKASRSSRRKRGRKRVVHSLERIEKKRRRRRMRGDAHEEKSFRFSQPRDIEMERKTHAEFQ